MLLQPVMLGKNIVDERKNRNTSERKVFNPIKGSLNFVVVVVVVDVVTVIEYYLWAIHY
jgi:hypothetical protein